MYFKMLQNTQFYFQSHYSHITEAQTHRFHFIQFSNPNIREKKIVLEYELINFILE